MRRFALEIGTPSEKCLSCRKSKMDGNSPCQRMGRGCKSLDSTCCFQKCPSPSAERAETSIGHQTLVFGHYLTLVFGHYLKLVFGQVKQGFTQVSSLSLWPFLEDLLQLDYPPFDPV
jgi:hypothetical protein